jgi:hypothetical protein
MSMTTKGKCQAKGGFENCGRENCPERVAQRAAQVPQMVTGSKVPQPVVFDRAWTEKDTVLFKTVHGSKLYGLDHAGSDDDFYVITPTQQLAYQNNTKQIFEGNNDTVYMDFSTFVNLAHKGAPQALETMFSQKSKSDFFESYRQGYHASDPAVIHTYMRTIKTFSLADLSFMSAKDVFKRKRHALRLAHNLEDLMYTGRFNPTLSKANLRKFTEYTEQDDDRYFTELKAVSPIEIDWDASDRKSR